MGEREETAVEDKWHESDFEGQYSVMDSWSLTYATE